MKTKIWLGCRVLSLLLSPTKASTSLPLLGFELVLKPKLWTIFLEVVNQFPNGIFMRISGPVLLPLLFLRLILVQRIGWGVGKTLLSHMDGKLVILWQQLVRILHSLLRTWNTSCLLLSASNSSLYTTGPTLAMAPKGRKYFRRSLWCFCLATVNCQYDC